ncbi:MAG: M81 family metallopeptidase [Armatimonadota bacterium]|nr:M81 family metallopeptidase [Armatimonadota bacterium]
MRIAVGGLWHETNTFAAGRTGLEAFHVVEGAAMLSELAGTRTPLGGFLDAAAGRGIEIVPTLFAWALPSALVSAQAHRALAGRLLDRLVAARPGAVFLDLHGAMAAEDSDDVEGALLEGLRARLGMVPTGVVFDYHANTTARFAELVDVFAGYETYPHTDPYDRGREVYALLERLLAGEVRPLRAHAQPPLLLPPQVQATAEPPMREVLERAQAARQRQGVLALTVAAGFPYADVPQAGPSVVVTADRDGAVARVVADDLARALWDARDRFRAHSLPPDEAVARALARGDGPVVLVDSADNVGGGAPGDGTVVLDALLRAGARGAVVAIADPEVVAAARAAGEGAWLDAEVGGKTDARHGAPVPVRARVVRLAPTAFTYRGSYMTGRRVTAGWTAILDAGGVHIVVRERKVMPFDAEELRTLGLDPAAYRIIVVKSAIAWRAAYGAITREVIEVDTPGVCTANLQALPYRKVRRPVVPLDPEVAW